MVNNRFVTNHSAEFEQANRSPIFGYEDSPVLTLEEALEEITVPNLDIMDHVRRAKKKFYRRSTLLTRDESAAIFFYSMPSTFYSCLNNTLRDEDREKLKPWFPFLKLFITALTKLPLVKDIVWRGVNFDDTLTESNYLFDFIKQQYQQNSRIERILNPAKSFPIHESYINLAIVTTKEQDKNEKQLRDIQYGDAIMSTFEEIYGMKSTIDIQDIFNTYLNQRKQVLVFGRAGIGKSIFCRYVAYKWATGAFWTEYKLLALIPLRCLTTDRYPPLSSKQSYSLVDLVKKEVLSMDPPEKEDSLLTTVFDANKTLWILDGYDEIVQNIPGHLKCLLKQLLNTPHHIVTSRPYLNTLSYDTKMEITGFKDENIKEYVEQFFNQMEDELDNAIIKRQALLNVQSNFISRECKCKIVSNKLHFPYHSWEISSCKLCGCDDVSMKNCEQACKLMMQAYTITGCGKVVRDSKVKYTWDASSCSSGMNKEEFSCS
ncbi:unnamed protein product [Rotaria sordida]|uniref:NACHT domain-containing protein n=1 Tax=Rotaria sordida TaxID=392033 RepID=A0A815Z6I9_9BILA|nr:unnamed protein product [Rotaria sordida]CAF1579536.1 unnamed protein product [Rotaria sordida]